MDDDDPDLAKIGLPKNNSLVNDGEFLYWLDICSGYYWPTLRAMELSSGAVSSVPGSVDGSHLAVSAAGDLLVLQGDSLNKVDPVTGVTTVLATVPGTVAAMTADQNFVWVSTTTSTDTRVVRVNLLTGGVDLLAQAPPSGFPGHNVSLAGSMVSAGGYLYVLAVNAPLLKVTKVTGAWQVVAGGHQGGFVDGTAGHAWFGPAQGIDTDGTSLWIADGLRIRTVEPGTPLQAVQPPGWATSLDLGVVSAAVVAGNGVDAIVDGTGTAASFSAPQGLVLQDGFAYTRDAGAIRRIDLATGQVATVSGPAPPNTQHCINSDDTNLNHESFGWASNTAVSDGSFLYWMDQCNYGGEGWLRRYSPPSGAISTTFGPRVSDALTMGPAGQAYVHTPSPECGGICGIDPVTGATAPLAELESYTYQSQTFVVDVRGMAADAENVYVSFKHKYNPYPQILAKISLASGLLTEMSVATDSAGSLPLAGQLVSAGGELYLTNGVQLFSVNKATNQVKPVLGVPSTNITGLDTDGANLYLASSADRRIYRLTMAKPISYLPDALTDDYPADGVGPSEFPGGSNLSMICACSQGQATGYPVNTQNGSFWHSFTDLTTPGPGPGVNVARTYVSANNTQDGVFGRGWSWSYGAHLTQDRGSQAVTIHQEDGSTIAFTENANDTYTPVRPRMMGALERNSDGTYTFVRKKRQIMSFDRRGRLVAVKDLNGYATTLAYDTGGDLTTITDDSGRSHEVTTGLAGRITSIADPAGNTYEYDYDNGDLASVTDPTGALTSFTYGSAHRMLSWTDPNQQDASSPTPLTNTYDAEGRVTSQTDFRGQLTTFTYSISGGTRYVEVHDPAGDVTIDTYNSKALRTSTLRLTPEGYAATNFTYDPNTFALATQTDPRGKTSTFTYDGRGNQLTSIDPLANQITSTYDALNNLLTATNADGVTTSHTYDSAGNILTTSKPLMSGATVVDTATTTYHYNDPNHPGQVTGLTDPEGHTTHYAYTSHGDLATVTTAATPDQPTGSVVTHAYDPHTSWLTSTVSARGNATGADPDDYRTRYFHDEVGRVVETRDPEWDSGTPNQHRTTATYDDNGNIVATRDARNNETTYTYNRVGQVIGTHHADGSDTHRSYTPDGLVATSTDANGEDTTYEYSSLDQVTAVTDPLARSTHHTYDQAGNQLTTRFQGGSCASGSSDDCIKYQYDDANQLTHINYSDTTPSVDFDYDDTGRLTTMTDGTGTSTWDHDSLDRLIGTTDGDGSTVTYDYDLADNRTAVTYPGNHTVTNAYNNRGQVTAVTDWNSHTTTFNYDPDGNLTTQSQPNGVASTYSYDPNGVVDVIDVTDATTTLATFSYTRNPAEQVTATVEAGAFSAAKDYDYDDVGQLAEDTGQSYGYDPAHNPEVMANGPSQTFDDASQLTTSTLGTTTTSYDFDNRGNRTTETSSPQVRGYQTNLDGTLTVVTTTPTGSPTQTATTESDGQGLRVNRTGPAGTQHFTYDRSSGMPLVIADSDNYYLYGPAGPIAQINATTGTASYLSADQLGSTRIITDATAAVTGTYTYDPYGNTTTHTGTATSPLQFNAQYHDTDTNLYWLRARYYDPTTAQFLTRDPLEAQTGQPYAYAANDPLNADDPQGLWPSLTTVLETVNDLNPMKPIVNGFITEYIAYDTGCGFWTAFGIGVKGTLHSALNIAALGFIAGRGPSGVTRIKNWSGREYKFGPNFRIAPFGNRTGHPTGKYPHYHRRVVDDAGETLPGQGIGRHRPWDTKPPDTSFWDRF